MRPPPKQITENAAPIPVPPSVVVQDHSKSPAVTPLSVAFRSLQPSWRNYIAYADTAARNGDAVMDRYVKVWLALSPRDRRSYTPEQICDLAQVMPGELVGAVLRAVWESKSAESGLVSAMAHPQLLARTIKLAEKAANYKDRELVFRMTGSLPKTGTSIAPSVTVNFPGAQPAIPILNTELESFDQESVSLARRLSPCISIEAQPINSMEEGQIGDVEQDSD